MNNQIVRRIKTTRKERKATQQDLADTLKKTAAAISDLERGKVQVSASDLYQIANFFNKPIEYFFGEYAGEVDVQDAIGAFRKMTSEGRSVAVDLITMMLSLEQFPNKQELLNADKEQKIKFVKQFYDTYVPYSILLNEMADQVNAYREIIDAGLKIINPNTDEEYSEP